MNTLSQLDVYSNVFRLFGRPVYRFGRPNSGAQKTFFKFSFFSCISTKKDVKVAINNFTMHLIISKWLRIQKCREKKKNNTKRLKQKKKLSSKRKKKLRQKVFSFIYVSYRSCEYLLFHLHKQFTLLRVIPSAILVASFNLFFCSVVPQQQTVFEP